MSWFKWIALCLRRQVLAFMTSSSVLKFFVIFLSETPCVKTSPYIWWDVVGLHFRVVSHQTINLKFSCLSLWIWTFMTHMLISIEFKILQTGDVFTHWLFHETVMAFDTSTQPLMWVSWVDHSLEKYIRINVQIHVRLVYFHGYGYISTHESMINCSRLGNFCSSCFHKNCPPNILPHGPGRHRLVLSVLSRFFYLRYRLHAYGNMAAFAMWENKVFFIWSIY